MKKQALAIVFLLVILISPVQAKEKNGWYLGTKIGWSHFNLLRHDTDDSKNINNNPLKNSLPSPIVGLFLGYEFNPYFSVEVENNTSGNFTNFILQKNKNNNAITNSVRIATKLSYPVSDSFNIYTGLGGMVFWDNLLSKEDLKNMFSKKSSLCPSVSLGAEYVFNNKFITRLDYTWKSNIQNMMDLSIRPSLKGDAVLSFGWKFGKPQENNIFSLYDHELLEQKYTTLNENINFPFDSTELKSNAYDKLEKLDNSIKNMKLKNISITLLGHSDRIGSHKYNKKLSEERAYTIKNYFSSRGFSNKKITVQGMGKLHPLTDKICQNIVNKPLLISCLAPDRRVEIEVLSSQ